MPLHPDVAAVLEARGPRRLTSMTVDEARAAHRAGAAARPPGPELAEVADLSMAGVPVRLYRPADDPAPRPALVFFHGGGWVLGGIDTHDRQCRLLAAGAGVAVVSVDYRLAPEHRFPAAFDDALAVTRLVLDHGPDHGIDRDRVAVGGDSAGGNLAAAVALDCRDQRSPAAGGGLRGQLLIYPAVDATMASPSFIEGRDGPFLSSEEMTWFYGQYRGTHPATDWRLSPLHASDLSGLAPALVVTAEFDPLRDEGEAYAQALAEAGVAATAVRYPGVSHGFFGWSHAAEPSRQLLAQCVDWLRRTLAR